MSRVARPRFDTDRVRRVLRWVFLAAYAAVFFWSGERRGYPTTDRFEVLLWLAGILVVVALFTPRLRVWRVVAEWVPFGLVFLAYDYSRGAADSLGMPLQVTPQITMDRWLGLGTVPTVWLQQHFLSQERVHAWQVIPSAAYLTHFIVPYAVAAWLWVRDHHRFVAYTERFVLLTFLGVATYVLFPWAPPWMASQRGLLPPLTRSVNDGWLYMDFPRAHHLFTVGQASVNLTAALPSLHAAYTVLIALFFWKRTRWWTRVVLVAYPLLMAFSLVFGAEHYVVDILLGWVYAVLIHRLCGRLDRWHERRRSRPQQAIDVAVAA